SDIRSCASCTTTKKQNVAVRVLYREATQSVIAVCVICERLKKLDIARREFRCQPVRIRDVQERVPWGPAFLDVSRVVRHGIDANVFDNDRRAAPLDDAEEDVVRLGPLKRDDEPEAVSIKRERGGNVSDNEERRNAGDVRYRHVNVPSGV